MFVAVSVAVSGVPSLRPSPPLTVSKHDRPRQRAAMIAPGLSVLLAWNFGKEGRGESGGVMLPLCQCLTGVIGSYYR